MASSLQGVCGAASTVPWPALPLLTLKPENFPGPWSSSLGFWQNLSRIKFSADNDGWIGFHYCSEFQAVCFLRLGMWRSLFGHWWKHCFDPLSQKTGLYQINTWKTPIHSLNLIRSLHPQVYISPCATGTRLQGIGNTFFVFIWFCCLPVPCTKS